MDNVLERPMAGPDHFAGRKTVMALCVSVTILFLLTITGILRINHGVFLYALDDPYIHLALSDQIAHGNYGINAGEHVAPSSSILFPFLLVVASGSRLHPYLPLLLNFFATLGTVEVMRRLLGALGLARAYGWLTTGIFILLLALSFNLTGVAFTGLEHSLHIFTTVLCLYGLVLFLDTRKLWWWWGVSIVLLPLWRYEGLALSFVAIAVLLLTRRWPAAALLGGLVLSTVGGFSLFLTSLKLSALPSSVLSKQTLSADGTPIGTGHFSLIRENLYLMEDHPIGLPLLLCAIVATAFCVMDYREKRRLTNRAMMAGVLTVLICAHAVAGKFGWFNRYEDYLLWEAAVALIYLFKDRLRVLATHSSARTIYSCAFLVAIAVAFRPYLYGGLRLVPAASNNVYEQQFQMHRFVDGYYRQAVAVNDIGLVSYHNPYYVLDLYGLGSQEARVLRSQPARADIYRPLIAAHGIKLVMIYEEWFVGRIPPEWVKVATLHVSAHKNTFAFADVQFYVTERDAARGVVAELEAFRQTLPAGDSITLRSF